MSVSKEPSPSKQPFTAVQTSMDKLTQTPTSGEQVEDLSLNHCQNLFIGSQFL